MSFYASDFETEPLSFSDDFLEIGDIVDLDQIDFTAFKSDSSQLTEVLSENGEDEIKLRSNLLRSNCRVTNQPDWGDVFIFMKGEKLPAADSLAKYIVSHRTVSHLTERFKPEQLMVSCLYTRRGGIDINPIRATHNYLIPEFFTNPEYIIRKTLRQ